MMRRLALMCAATCLLAAPATHADPALDALARDLDRTQSIRQIKDLQSTFAQYAQFGLWEQMGALFPRHGRLVFDGLVQPAQTATGPARIAAFLRDRYGGGREGASTDGLSTMLIDSPVASLAADGASARVRWQAIILHGHDGQARIEGGVFVNDYVREGGVWKIATLQYYPQYDGPYEEGWTNWGGGDLPVAPYHFDPRTAGIPIAPPAGTAPPVRATLAQLQQRIDALNDIDRVRNLQSAFGYYEDRKLWDDVTDLFAADGVVEVGGQNIWRGHAGVRSWLAGMGGPGLKHGQLNDRVQANVIVTVSRDGSEAFARGIELGMLGEADREQGWWEVAVFRNRFVKEQGVWKLRELRRHVLMKTDVFQGWGRSRLANAPVVPMPAFLGNHPVTGRPVKPVGKAALVSATPLTGSAPRNAAAPVTIEEARRRLARSAAYDGATNISAAYGFYIDDSNAAGWANTMAEKGFKETPFAGYHIGRDRLIKARVRGPGPDKQAGISYHWLLQPVVLVSDDGRSSTGRFRLFQPRTGKTVGKAGDFFAAQFWGGMYHNRYVLEDGGWRIWELTLDEPYIVPVAWKDGVWARSKDPATPRAFTPNADIDVPVKLLERRKRHFWGGPGPQLQWPSILPMWFTYTNPVSGRVPEFHQPDCVPCALRPELNLDRNGYQEPPDAPAANRAP